MNMDPSIIYAACTDIVLRRISVYWMIEPFQWSTAGYAPVPTSACNIRSTILSSRFRVRHSVPIFIFSY